MLKKITEEKIKELSKEYSTEDIIAMGKDRFNDMVKSEVEKELNDR